MLEKLEVELELVIAAAKTLEVAAVEAVAVLISAVVAAVVVAHCRLAFVKVWPAILE